MDSITRPTGPLGGELREARRRDDRARIIRTPGVGGTRYTTRGTVVPAQRRNTTPPTANVIPVWG
jgi:hypothetical protein